MKARKNQRGGEGDKDKAPTTSSTDHLGKKLASAVTGVKQDGGRRRRKSRGHKSRGRRTKHHRTKHHKKHARRTKRKGRKGRKGKRGGSVVGTAALPFGLLALQKFFQTRKGRKDLKKMSKTVRKSVRKVRRSL